MSFEINIKKAPFVGFKTMLKDAENNISKTYATWFQVDKFCNKHEKTIAKQTLQKQPLFFGKNKLFFV